MIQERTGRNFTLESLLEELNADVAEIRRTAQNLLVCVEVLAARLVDHSYLTGVAQLADVQAAREALIWIEIPA